MEDLNRFEAGQDIDIILLKKLGIVKQMQSGLKILGNGEIEVALNVRAAKFSVSAKDKIEKAGGKAIVEPFKAKTAKTEAEEKSGD